MGLSEYSTWFDNSLTLSYPKCIFYSLHFDCPCPRPNLVLSSNETFAPRHCSVCLLGCVHLAHENQYDSDTTNPKIPWNSQSAPTSVPHLAPHNPIVQSHFHPRDHFHRGVVWLATHVVRQKRHPRQSCVATYKRNLRISSNASQYILPRGYHWWRHDFSLD